MPEWGFGRWLVVVVVASLVFGIAAGATRAVVYDMLHDDPVVIIEEVGDPDE